MEALVFLSFAFRVTAKPYLIDARILIDLYENGKKQSISYKELQELGSLIRESLTPRLCYLDNVDDLFFKEEINYGKES